MQFISSPQNGHIKELKAYQDKAKKRKQESVFCIEGEKEIRHALKGGFRLKTVFVKQGYTDNVNDEAFTDCECIEVANALFENYRYPQLPCPAPAPIWDEIPINTKVIKKYYDKEMLESAQTKNIGYKRIFKL